jgi:hypothetical protein
MLLRELEFILSTINAKIEILASHTDNVAAPAVPVTFPDK